MSYAALNCQELVCLCATTGSTDAWQEFVDRFNGLITSVAYRTARRWTTPSPELIEDLVQDVYLRLCANRCQRLVAFQAEAPEAFFGFLKVVTTNLVQDHFKTAMAHKRGCARATIALDDCDPPARIRGTDSAHALEQKILLQQVDNWLIVTGCDPSARTIFWLYYRHGLTAAAIAAMPKIGLTVKGVESMLFRITRQARSELAGHRDLCAA
jgi:RNA polymerase sigma-70 factor (ECF subfamily)